MPTDIGGIDPRTSRDGLRKKYHVASTAPPFSSSTYSLGSGDTETSRHGWKDTAPLHNMKL
eukprot:6603766-Pyramimonas_sp.AAC.1